MPVPNELRTERLLLRRWRATDAPRLRPVLEANQAHIAPWIPKRVSDPAPLAVLASRLAGFEAEFDATREWRYGLFLGADETVLGEVALFPRDATRRVALDQADRAEIGYWLREDHTGRGLATEAARAMLDLAATLPALRCVEIRCDARNAVSAGVARRLGFALAETMRTDDGEDQLWSYALGNER